MVTMILKRIYKKILKIVAFKRVAEKESIFTKTIFKEKKYNIGEFTYGKPTILFDTDEVNLTIGKFCSIASEVTIFLGGNHRVDWLTTYPFNILNKDFKTGKNIVGHPATKGSVVIGNDVWIGKGVTIMSGIKIGNGAVIGAGALVTKNVGDYEIWAGNPSKFIKKRFSDQEINKLNELSWWDWDIEKISKNVKTLCSDNIQEFLQKHYD